MLIKSNVCIVNKLGLHARASAKFVSTAARYMSRIDVHHGKKVVNGKSIMGVMALAATKGSTLELHIDGPDAEDMNTHLLALIADRFGEDE